VVKKNRNEGEQGIKRTRIEDVKDNELEKAQQKIRNEYQEYFLGGKGGRCLWLTILPPSCANCLEIWDP
jgi:hypothetical protein